MAIRICVIKQMLSSITQTAQLPSIGLSTTQTSLLVFPAPITYIDKGRGGLVAEKARNDLHVLLVKAGQEKFPSTNLHVLTADGSVYAFPVFYEPAPVKSFFRLNSLPDISLPRDLPLPLTEKLESPISGKTPASKTGGVYLQVTGIQVYDDHLYCQILLGNTSGQGYSVEDISVFLKEKHRKTKSAMSDIPICPQLIAGAVFVSPRSQQSIIIALSRQSIREKQSLFIQVTEKEGNRNLLIKMDHKFIVQAQSIVLV